MTRDDCKAIMEHLPLIKALAEGKDIYFAMFTCEGKFIKWNRTNKILLSPMASGFYSLKPRYQCIKPGQHRPIPSYIPEQFLERIDAAMEP